MPRYTPEEQRNIDAANSLFEAEPEDKSSLFAEDSVWWNGLPFVRSPGVTEHVGIDAIREILTGAGRPRSGNSGVDSYDLTTSSHEDVVVLADGDYVMRQHTFRAKTHGGQNYANVYCFVFRFNAEGKIQYLTEHWNTWHAHNVLLNNFAIEPAHPEG